MSVRDNTLLNSGTLDSSVIGINEPIIPDKHEDDQAEVLVADVSFAEVLNALTNPVMVIDKADLIVKINSSCESFFQSGRKNLIGSTLAGFVPYGSRLFETLKSVRKLGAPVSEYRVDLSTPMIGRGKIVDIYVSLLQEIGGCVVVEILQRTVTDKIDRQLEHQSAVRKAYGLSSMLAHEIKNPLSGIKGAAQLLSQSAGDDDRALTRLIEDEVDRITKLVNRMEMFSELRPLEQRELNIHSVLDHVKMICANGFGKHVKITEQYDPSLPMIYGDRDQLVQVFLNLMKNAAEAVSETSNPVVSISTAFRQGVRLSVSGQNMSTALPIEVTICDNGPGVDTALVAHMFEPFVTTKPNGTGLGLAMVAKTISEHGGVIEMDDNGEGTAFKVLLPVSRREPEGEGERA